jgi:tRNA modification GTPase
VYHTDDTIVAVASAAGGAARAIVRLSGPRTAKVLDACFRPLAGQSLADVHFARSIVGELDVEWTAGRCLQLPVDLYLWPDARSYTRQPAAEIHMVGSPPLAAAVVATLCRSGARPAEPGEFTLRAFLAGRIDLTQAEAVLGVVDARGETQLRQALVQLAGGLAGPLAALRGRLLDLLAELEAGLDFVEEDIEFVTAAQVQNELQAAVDAVADARRQLSERGSGDAWPRVTLLGLPNVGKSSLYNALAGSAAALVSNRPGTTRDYLTTTLKLDGVSCQLIDTAGAEPGQAGQSIAAAAQRQMAAQHEQAEVRLLCLDATRPLNAWERDQLAAKCHAVDRIVVATKCDLQPHADLPADVIRTSSVTGLGLEDMRRAIRRAVVESVAGEAQGGLTAQRCEGSLRLAGEALARAQQISRGRESEELLAAEIRVALAELGNVVGAVYTDDILDRIFSRFCIGK